MKNWFSVTKIDRNTYSLSEYRHWEETNCYLICGNEKALLIDTGLGICDISAEVKALTDLTVAAAATHVHWDHIGGHRYYPEFYAHGAELEWLNGAFPLPPEAVRKMVLDRCEAPEGFRVEDYEIFQGMPSRVLRDGDVIDLGGRKLEVLHTPGHSPGHMCFWEAETGYLFTGDLIYKGEMYAYYPSTEPAAYLQSVERIAALPVRRVFPGHHSPDVEPEFLIRVRDAFRELEKQGKLRHGGGRFRYEDFGIWI